MNAEEAKAYLNANPGALIYDRDGSSWGRDGAQVHTPSGPNSEEWGPFQKEKPGGNESDIQSPAAGRKDDTGKPRISLLPEDVLREVIAVFEHGAAKYGDDNWRGVEPAERYRDASFRHVHLERGPDPDSGIDALAHGIASLMILRARQLEAGK